MSTTPMSMKCLFAAGLLMSGPLAAQDLTAVTGWNHRVTLSTVVSGMVARVNVTSGDLVERGALLLELDQRKTQARLAAAESRREAASQLNSEARRELERSLELYERTLLSDHERKLAEIDAAKADAELREAEARLTEVRLQKAYSRLTAPFDAQVVELHVQPGQAVVNRLQPMPLVTLVDQRRMKALAQADAATLSRLRVGGKVKIGVRGEWLEGEIASLGLDPITTGGKAAAYRVEASFAPTEGMRLRAGESVVIRLPDE
jgi:RND family efflux transporter MFP subunit